MEFGCGGSVEGNGGGGDKDQGSQGSEGLKRKWGDVEATMKAVKDAVVKENAENPAKIRRLMRDNVRLKQTRQTVLRFEQGPSQGPIRPMPRQNPFAVFPAEVWEAIIQKMNWTSDLESFCLAFPELESLVMERKKTIVLFKKVIPLVSRHLHMKDVNSCRLVCGSWNEDVCALLAASNAPIVLSIDALNKKQIATTPLPDHQLRMNWMITSMLADAYFFRDHRKIESFLNKMADHPGNSLFGRFLSLSVNDKTEFTHFWQSALELVRKFGEHVWNLEIKDFRYSHNNQIDFYKAVQEALIHLPNLKYLTVEGNFTGHGPSQANVAAQVGNAPLPPLPYLQSLKLTFTSETGLGSALSVYFSPQIRRLQLDNESFANLKDECLRGLINLEDLEVELHLKEDVSRLLKFPVDNLKKVLLHAQCYPSPPVSFTPKQFASLVEKISRLEHRLDITRCQVEPNSSLGSRLQFSELKTLKIAVAIGEDERQHNLDFLLRFSSLKHLVIDILFMGRTGLSFDEYDYQTTLKIRNYLYYGRMLESNIWTLMPSLVLLESRGTYRAGGQIYPKGNGIYTREMFENRNG